MTDFKNTEGYADPTPYCAIKKIEAENRKYRPLVYICSPYAGNVKQNTEITRRFCRFALDSGQIPLAPHLLFPQFMNDSDPEERALALLMDIVLLGKCKELWVLGTEITDGMLTEIETAKRRRQPIRWFNADFEEVTES